MPDQAHNESQIIIRPALIADVAAIARLIDPFVEQRKLLPRAVVDLQELIPTGFAADVSGKIVGFAALVIYSKKFSEIQCLAVAEECHGQGIGRRLVESCVNLAREHEILEIMAISSNERFLSSCGFDFALPDEKKAMFLQTRNIPGR